MSARTEAPIAIGPDLSGGRILVVEDDAGHAEAIRRAFENVGLGANLRGVRTLAEFRQEEAAGSLDLALVDYKLPDGRAIEILTSPPEDGPFPVLVMTSFGNEQIAVEAMRSGAIDYVVKSPEAFAGMPRIVERALGQWRVLQEKKRTELRNRQLTRVYGLLSGINQAIVRIRNLEALLPEACRIAVEVGGFQAAWIGLFQPDSTKLLFSRQAGRSVVGLEDPGPGASTLETGKRTVCNDVRIDEAGALWREAAIRHDLLAWAALPLVVEGATIGSFCLFSGEPGLFDETEMELLDELAMDLSFAIETSRKEVARAKAEAEIERLNASLEERIRERTAQLESANRELESFSYSVSHDLRAPLRAIDGFSRLLAEESGNRLDEKARDRLGRIRDGVGRMGRLVDDLLSLAKLGRATVKPEPLDLGSLASEIDAELRAANPGRRVEFLTATGLVARADPSLAGILLRNLLGNAWKFTSKKPAARVEIGVEGTEAERVFFVRDDGAGFDTGLAFQLFEPFRRLHRTDEFEGSGIGLAIVRRIVQRHGGRAWIEGAEGRGATVRFTLPDPIDGPKEGVAR